MLKKQHSEEKETLLNGDTNGVAYAQELQEYSSEANGKVNINKIFLIFFFLQGRNK